MLINSYFIPIEPRGGDPARSKRTYRSVGTNFQIKLLKKRKKTTIICAIVGLEPGR